MRRLFLVVVFMSLLTACSTAPRPTQGPSTGELRPGGTGQISPAKPSPPSASPVSANPAPPSPAPASPAPASPAQTSPAPVTPVESPCSFPSAETLQAKGELLLADGNVKFYGYPWGADCTFRHPVNTWLVSNGTVSRFLVDKGEVDGVKLLVLPSGDHVYLVHGDAVTPSASAYYLAAVRYDEPRLFRLLSQDGLTDEMVSTAPPDLTGDQLETAQRVSMNPIIYLLRTWKLDPQSLTATVLSEKESEPIPRP